MTFSHRQIKKLLESALELALIQERAKLGALARPGWFYLVHCERLSPGTTSEANV